MGCIFSQCFVSEDSDDRHRNTNPAPFNLSTTVLAQVCCNLFVRRQHQQHITSSTSPSPSSSSSNQLTSMLTVPHSSTCDTFRSPPPPLPYNSLKYSPQRQHHGFHSKQGNKSSRPLGIGGDSNVFDTKNECKLEISPECSVKKLSEKVMIGIGYASISSDEEEEESCPICLEDYTDENPCITMLCSHKFHLGCLCEWIERSDDCPICGKAMIFDEAC
ncbi:RING/U-box superfamily protein [Zostera marina]|uniref:RING-type E3 ubiquitin transferase n=1 Tax=Zostera marina TaxID=29655 RepID=A0A0K9NT71_ZOSMR|nr:RING/U-box superfamily protein [Zostera marina]